MTSFLVACGKEAVKRISASQHKSLQQFWNRVRTVRMFGRGAMSPILCFVILVVQVNKIY